MPTSSQMNGNSSLEIAHSNQELIVSKGRRKKRTCIIVSVILALIVLALIIAAIVLLKSPQIKSQGHLHDRSEPTITLEEVVEGRLMPKGFNATLVPGGQLLYRNQQGDLWMYNIKKRSSRLILPVNNSRAYEAAIDLELSPDQKFLMVSHEYHKLYRHSYIARYTIINLKTFEEIPVLIGSEFILQYATWGPVGNAVVFVQLNNIYYKPNAYSEPQAITSDGILNTIHNGIPDWVYEEEVFSSNRAVWFSPDGKKMAYGRFNDSLVGFMNIPVYGQPGSLQSQYSRALQIRYPKPGTTNPDVTLHVVDLENFQATTLPPPDNLRHKEPILAAVTWATGNIVSAVWMNRVQNQASLMSYDTQSLNSETVHYFEEKHGWCEFFTAPKFSKDGSKIIFLWSHDQGNKFGAYRHVTMMERKPHAKLEPITSGLFVVSEILGWDEEKEVVYFQSNSEEDPVTQHVYSVSLKTKKTHCLSCSAESTLQKTKCLHNSAKFTSDFSHYVLNCAGPGVPQMTIRTIPNEKHKSEITEIWESNSELVNTLSQKSLPVVERYNFTTAGGFKAQVMLKLPPNMIRNGDVKYPMLVNVYGGPDSNQVSDKFNMDWGSYLAANKSIIYASIDGRGSGQKGNDLLFSVYKRLGTVEILDQINITRQLQELPFVDPERSGIWGWSYGGYASAMALAQDKDRVFKCGISVAPVTDWALYDSIYTERFMGLPKIEDNLQGYVRAQLLNKFEGLKDKMYFLVHGTLDDNVHYQQSMMWSKVLEQNDILFRQQSYPDEDHGLASVRPHLYHTLEQFLDECFIEK